MLHIIFNPFVSSKIPEIKPKQNSFGICKTLKIGSIISESKNKTLLFFKIEIITEKSTINPPINKIVLIELVILFPIIPPKFDNDISSILLELTE